MIPGRALAALAALVLGWPACSHGQSLDDAKTFVRGLYQAYARGNGPDYLGRQAPGVFSPRLLQLIRRDERLTPKGDVPSLDGDPICDCQDPGGLHLVAIEVSGTGEARARARVRFRFDSERRALRLDLVAVSGKWRVDDVHSRDTPSLAKFLIDAHRPEHPAG